MRRLVSARPGRAVACAALMFALMLAGAFAWFEPYLTQKTTPTASTPGPPPIFSLAGFSIARGQRACMSSVTITSNSRLAMLVLRPAVATPRGGPPVELTLSAQGYAAHSLVPGGYPGGTATIPISPPRTSVIGTACFVNRGTSTVVLNGTSEPRSISRSPTEIAGRPVVGDITLTFLDNRTRSLLGRLGELFEHASALTDGLVPVWLEWIITMLIAFGVPAATVGALFLALRSEELRS